MKQFQFEILFHIIGIGSASGIIYKDNSIFLISDNGNNLYEFIIDRAQLIKTPLYDSAVSDNIPKNIKPDFEAILEFDDTLYIFGSGSTENRNKMVIVDIATKKVLSTVDLTDLYTLMQSFGEVSATDFNIEGVVYNEGSWYFFQRGNGATGKNGVFTVTGDFTGSEFSIVFNQFTLPKIKRIESSFTDATLVGDKIYFLATAENTKSTYDDGDILGSFIGTIDLNTMKIGKTLKITDTQKLEGLTLYASDDSSTTFLLCEDNDTDGLQSEIFKLTIKK